MYTEKQTIYSLYSSIVHTNVHVNLIGNLFNLIQMAKINLGVQVSGKPEFLEHMSMQQVCEPCMNLVFK